MTGRLRVCSSHVAAWSIRASIVRSRLVRRSLIRRDSSAQSGTIRLPASVGVEARRSATRSSRGASCSWPIALTTGVRAAATARIRDSSLNGSRSSRLPPPRANTMTSTLGSASSSARLRIMVLTAEAPCTAPSRTSNWADGQRWRALVITSCIAWALTPVIRPIRRGSSGRRRLSSGANRPSAASCCLRRSSVASSSPMPDRADLAGAQHEPAVADPVLALHVHQDALPGGQGWVHRAIEATRDHDRHRGVDVHVADRQVHLRAAAPADLDDLALDPHAVQPGDVVTQLHRDLAHRPGAFRCGAVRGGAARGRAAGGGVLGGCGHGRESTTGGRHRWASLTMGACLNRVARSCSQHRAATAPAWTGPWSPSRRPSSCTARRCTSARRSSTTATWSTPWRRVGPCSSTRPTRSRRAPPSCSAPTGSRRRSTRRPRRATCGPSTRPARWSPRCTTRPVGSPMRATGSCSSAMRAMRRSRAPWARPPRP